MRFEEVRQKVKEAINQLRYQDQFLIDADANERTISHRLAESLQNKFPKWKVDCEYNRHRYDVKKLRNLAAPNNLISWDDQEAKTIFPDTIIHNRNTDENNLLAIELKKSTNLRHSQFDKDKLVALTKDDYHYCFGLFFVVSMDNTTDYLEWYVEGKKIHEEKTPV